MSISSEAAPGGSPKSRVGTLLTLKEEHTRGTMNSRCKKVGADASAAFETCERRQSSSPGRPPTIKEIEKRSKSGSRRTSACEGVAVNQAASSTSKVASPRSSPRAGTRVASLCEGAESPRKAKASISKCMPRPTTAHSGCESVSLTSGSPRRVSSSLSRPGAVRAVKKDKISKPPRGPRSFTPRVDAEASSSKEGITVQRDEEAHLNSITDEALTKSQLLLQQLERFALQDGLETFSVPDSLQAGFPLGSFKLKPAEVPEELLGMKEAEDALEAKLPDGYGVSDMSTDVTAASVSDGNPEPSTVELSEMLVEMRSELQRLRCMRSIETSDLAAAGAVAKTDTVPVPTELLQMIVDMWQELQRLISKVSKDSKDSKELLSPTSLKTSTTCKSVVTVMSSTTTEQEVVTDEATNSEEALPSPDFPWPTRGSDFGASLTTDANWTPPSGPPEPENFVQRMHTCDSALDTHRADMSSIPMLPAQAFRTGHDTQTWGPSKLENQSWGPPKHVVRMKSVPSHVPSAYQPSVLDPVAVSTQPEQELSPTHALRRTIPGVQPARCETPSSKTTRSMMSGASSSMQSPATGLRSPCSPRPVSPNRVVAMVPSVQAAQSPSLALRSPRPSPRPSSPPGRMVPCPVVHSPVAGMRSSRPELAMVQAAAPLRSPTPSINSSMRSPTPSMQWVRVPSTYGPPAGGAKMQPLLVHRQVAITETYMKLDGDAARSLPPS
mmetsp:Transcript_139184/g.259556  ORF Transcript_139184/g.259556 Transcript_139184/m.259556 type:complete len:725 (-) Transcript_139184:79-2253(-)